MEHQTADEKAEKAMEGFLREIGPSKAVERFLSGYSRPRTRRAYAMELMEYRRWLVAEGVLLAMPDRFRTPLLIEWQSGIEINRVLETDWSFALEQEPPVKVDLFGRKRHRKAYSTFIGTEARDHLRALRKGMPCYQAVCDNLQTAIRRLSGAGQLKNGDVTSWHSHALRHSFKTEAEHAEAKSGVIEYFMGHIGGIQWVYNHRAEVHSEDFVKEYMKIEPYVSLHPGEVQVRESYEEREQTLLKRVVLLEQRLERMASGQPSAP